jgi:methylenetetrahydrofolate--tRNA-(uracil-5-)-methyltransferase
MKKINIVGAGLAGCEAAWQIAQRGIKVVLHEMRLGEVKTIAHRTQDFAELVCSNSFRNDEITSAIGLLHEEMRLGGSLIMEAGMKFKVPAGGALAVDRDAFSQYITQKLSSHPLIEISNEEIKALPQNLDYHIFATGPLTSGSLSEDIIKVTGRDKLAFFDAIAPIVYKDTINFDIAWFQSRYDKAGPGGDGRDYINCPLNKEQYYNFIDAIANAEQTEFKDWEKDTPFFDGCLPIEEMIRRGRDTLRFGPMKPVGLVNPNSQIRPYAVVQLRQDNKIGSLYNIVGFQTKLKYGSQADVFRMIPGLEKAEFARLGGIHRNTFINSPKLLSKNLSLKDRPNIKFTGQITGVEGYIESAAMGYLAGIFTAKELLREPLTYPPVNTAHGALLEHITNNADSEIFQPMNINFGLFPEIDIRDKKHKRQFIAETALSEFKKWLLKIA